MRNLRWAAFIAWALLAVSACTTKSKDSGDAGTADGGGGSGGTKAGTGGTNGGSGGTAGDDTDGGSAGSGGSGGTGSTKPIKCGKNSCTGSEDGSGAACCTDQSSVDAYVASAKSMCGVTFTSGGLCLEKDAPGTANTKQCPKVDVGFGLTTGCCSQFNVCGGNYAGKKSDVGCLLFDTTAKGADGKAIPNGSGSYPCHGDGSGSPPIKCGTATCTQSADTSGAPCCTDAASVTNYVATAVDQCGVTFSSGGLCLQKDAPGISNKVDCPKVDIGWGVVDGCCSQYGVCGGDYSASKNDVGCLLFDTTAKGADGKAIPHGSGSYACSGNGVAITCGSNSCKGSADATGAACCTNTASVNAYVATAVDQCGVTFTSGGLCLQKDAPGAANTIDCPKVDIGWGLTTGCCSQYGVCGGDYSASKNDVGCLLFDTTAKGADGNAIPNGSGSYQCTGGATLQCGANKCANSMDGTGTACCTDASSVTNYVANATGECGVKFTSTGLCLQKDAPGAANTVDCPKVNIGWGLVNGCCSQYGVCGGDYSGNPNDVGCLLFDTTAKGADGNAIPNGSGSYACAGGATLQCGANKCSDSADGTGIACCTDASSVTNYVANATGECGVKFGSTGLCLQKDAPGAANTIDCPKVNIGWGLVNGCCSQYGFCGGDYSANKNDVGCLLFDTTAKGMDGNPIPNGSGSYACAGGATLQCGANKCSDSADGKGTACCTDSASTTAMVASAAGMCGVKFSSTGLCLEKKAPGTANIVDCPQVNVSGLGLTTGCCSQAYSVCGGNYSASSNDTGCLPFDITAKGMDGNAIPNPSASYPCVP